MSPFAVRLDKLLEKMERIDVKTFKNHKIAVDFFTAENPRDEIVVIASATGVKQRYYASFATYLSSEGFHVFTFDYTGIGDSLCKPLREVDTNAVEWATNDLESVIQYAEQRFPKNKIHLIGHSIGGQIIGFAPSSISVSTIVIVASQSGFWGLWKGFYRYAFWFVWNLLLPVLLWIYGYLPSKNVMGMENLPKNMGAQWSGWCRRKNYFMDVVDPNQLYYSRIRCSLFSISLEGDIFAPKEAVDWLASQYSNASVRRIHWHPKDFNREKIGHFDVFREVSKAAIWPILLQCISTPKILTGENTEI